MLVNLVKRTGTYFSERDNKDKPFVNFYLQCNDQLIPIEPKYFPQAKFDNRDPGYQKRFGILEFCADLLPDLPEKEDKKDTAAAPSAALTVTPSAAPSSGGSAF